MDVTTAVWSAMSLSVLTAFAWEGASSIDVAATVGSVMSLVLPTAFAWEGGSSEHES